MLEAVVVIACAFAAGAVPFSNLVALRMRGTDLRAVGSGTVSGTALYRVAGFGPLALAGVGDVAKGALGPLLAGDRPALAAFAAGATVVGHDWSPFLRGAGGRGIAPALGALAVLAWPGVILVVVALVVGRLAGRTGLACFVGDVALVPLLAVTSGWDAAFAGTALAVPMLVKRILGDRPVRPNAGAGPPGAGSAWRVYGHRLLFDRDPGGSPR